MDVNQLAIHMQMCKLNSMLKKRSNNLITTLKINVNSLLSDRKYLGGGNYHFCNVLFIICVIQHIFSSVFWFPIYLKHTLHSKLPIMASGSVPASFVGNQDQQCVNKCVLRYLYVCVCVQRVWQALERTVTACSQSEVSMPTWCNSVQQSCC